MKPIEPLLTTKQVAEMLGIKPDTLDFWRFSRPIDEQPPFIKVGRRNVRYRPSDVEAWLTKQTKGL